ncbi:Lar family restriction alleviation protein, partial [Enterobacter hormaechei subsp. steigerwaltii]|uniref:Lar family restriction alleviation protein n=1 Tax=Enterobacter hormaechei TaxID=158836 RepID=UPI003F4302B9
AVAYIRDGFRADGVHFCGGIITAEEHERTKPALSDRYNWKHQPLYTAPPVPVSVPDENGLLPCPCCGGRADFDFDDDNLNWISCNVCGISTDTAYHTDVDARDRLRDVWNHRAAMLQGAEPVTTAYKLPFEQWLPQQTGTIDVECGCVMTEVFFHWLRVAYEAGNSPVIPDGWVLVPIEPTYQMCEAMGLPWESPRFPDRYKAMIAAAPQQEVK